MASFDSVILVQEWLMSITVNTFDEAFEGFRQTSFFTDPKQFYRLTVNLQEALLRRPYNLPLYADLLSKLNATEFVNYFVEYLFAQLAEKVAILVNTFIPAFLLCLIERSLLTQVHLVKLISLFFDQKVQNVSSIEWLYCWFAPEISEIDAPLFENMATFLKTRSSSQEISMFYNHINVHIDRFSENNWRLLRETRSRFYGANNLCHVIINDNLSELRILASDPAFDFNQAIPRNIYEAFWLFQKSPTLLMISAFSGSWNCFQFLRTNGASIDAEDRTSRNVLQYAVSGGSLEMIRHLQQNGFLFSQALPHAVSFHHNDLFHWIYEQERPDLNQSMDRRGSCVNQALNSNNISIFLFCLQEQYQIESSHDGNTILHYTAMRGFNELFDFALKSEISCDPNEKGTGGKTALHLACEFGNLYAVERLLEMSDIDINLKDNEGSTPMFSAISFGSLEIVQLLLNHPDIDVSIRNAHGDSVLHIAAMQGNPKILALLIPMCKDLLNSQNHSGSTPLYYAASFSNDKICELLLSLDLVDPEIRTVQKMLPLFSAILRLRFETTEMLLRNHRTTPKTKAQAFEVAKQSKNQVMINYVQGILVSMHLNYPPLYRH